MRCSGKPQRLRRKERRGLLRLAVLSLVSLFVAAGPAGAGEDPTSIADRLTELLEKGEAELEAGQIPEAVETLRSALRYTAENYGEESVVWAVGAKSLASVLQRSGDHEDARSLLERVLAIDEKRFGSEHPDLVGSLYDLAWLLQDMHDYAAALPFLERALAIREEQFGPEHPSRAADLNNLAGLLRKMGDYAAARPLYERALTIAEAQLGPDHPDTARYLNQCAEQRNFHCRQQ